MQAYEECTRPLASYYERAGKLVPIEAAGAPEEILDRSLQALKQGSGTTQTES
jgi:adenylate kinase family enzyme